MTTQWRDPITGINPFLPTKSRKELSSLRLALSSVKNNVAGPLISCVKLFFIVLLYTTAALFFRLEFMLLLIANPVVSQSYRAAVSFVFGRAALFMLGFYNIPSEQAWSTKGQVPANNKLCQKYYCPNNIFFSHSLRKRHELKKSTSTTIESGDIIVANHTSYIDILYLFTFFSPVFTQISAQTGRVCQIPVHHALMRTGEYPDLNPPQCTQTLAELCDIARNQRLGPVVVFPEATTTNGRALLQFTRVLDGIDAKHGSYKIHIIALKYIFDEYAPTYTIGGKFSHLIGLGAQFYNTLSVKICFYSPANFDGKYDANDTSDAKMSHYTSVPVQTLVSQMTKLKFTSFDINDKKEFFDFLQARDEGR
ncbi:hypothetical protein HK100_004577 [Physocladia obscura]|uniref:Phospholipid/glycerol acyltransferase domain-containing protein n=1 Tax=Physocladia obscura TaxID=109957 RepID=A0AAD5SSX4_9FUNG|nr:hypothetical protein HK100_004577 [Physocladia obscura]